MKFASIGFVIIGFILFFFSRQGIAEVNEDFYRFSGLLLVAYFAMIVSVLLALAGIWGHLKEKDGKGAKDWLWHYVLIWVACFMFFQFFFMQREYDWLWQQVAEGNIKPGP